MTAIGFVCESPLDFDAGLALERRVACDAINWLDPETYASTCPHVGLEAGSEFTTWRDLAKVRGSWPARRAHGHFSGEPGAPMAMAARTALLNFVSLTPTPDAVILLKDGDDQPAERARGLDQARRARDWPFKIVIGVPNPEIESWYLASFVASTPDETRRLDAERERLGFDPTRNPERLTSKREHEPKDCKRALAALIGSDSDRRSRSLTSIPVDELREHGAANGLAAFIAELKSMLVPLISGGPRR